MDDNLSTCKHCHQPIVKLQDGEITWNWYHHITRPLRKQCSETVAEPEEG
jgi:hypothetical protein